MSKRQFQTWVIATVVTAICCLSTGRAPFGVILLFLSFTPHRDETIGEMAIKMRLCLPVAFVVCGTTLLLPWIDPTTGRVSIHRAFFYGNQALTVATGLSVLLVGRYRARTVHLRADPTH